MLTMLRINFLFFCVVFSSYVWAAEPSVDPLNQWHQWRGPLANGTAPQGDPPLKWDENTNIKWKIKIPGKGNATPIVWNDQVFVVTAIKTDRKKEKPKAEPQADPKDKTAKSKASKNKPPEKQRSGRGRYGRRSKPENYYQFVVISYDRKTGKEKWRKIACEKVPHEGHHSTNTFSSSSPTTDGKRLYVSFGSQGVYCYDLKGSFLWKRELGTMRTRNGWGETVTPVVHGDSLIVNRDQEDQSYILLLNAKTGKTLWKKKRDEKSTWATPLIVSSQGKIQAIVNGSNRVRSYDLLSGKLLWECGGQTGNPIPSPVLFDKNVICMSGFRSAAVYSIPLNSKGDLTDSKKYSWKRNEGTPYVPSPLLYKNQLYFTQSIGNTLSVINPTTGKPVYSRKRLEGVRRIYASPVAASGRVYFVGRSGTTLVIKHGKKLQILATNKLDDHIDASPAIVGQQIFLRGDQHLYCIEKN